MKKVVYLIAIFGLFFFTTQVHAAYVRYVDKNGKFHYVNTEYSKVPTEYLDQVRDQMPQPNSAIVSGLNLTGPVIPTNPSTIPYPMPNTVELYVKANCVDCDRLETLLQANQIKYLRYDIENSQEGREFYKNLTNTNMPFPLTRVNGQIFPGNDIAAIKTALRAASAGTGPLPITSQNLPNAQNMTGKGL